MPRDRLPDPITAAIAATGMAMSAGAGGVGIFQSVQGSKAAEKQGRRAHHVTQRLEGIRSEEGRVQRRKLAARAQLMGASGGSPTGDAQVAQIARDIDRQTALDVWAIRERGYQARSQSAQESAAFKNQAISQGLELGSSLIKQGVGYHSIGVF